ncbi:unnamed protein product [Polarella glacialis]|uniref:Uncharacterized protein n=1 Tax=Polarella glacialis TaxID=89957 RepID=A0A813LV16_POLGL|nr:unnamed protein product [Polarella glacialis]
MRIGLDRSNPVSRYHGGSNSSLILHFAGRDAANIAVLALESLHRLSRKEVIFSVKQAEIEGMTGPDGKPMRGFEVLVTLGGHTLGKDADEAHDGDGEGLPDFEIKKARTELFRTLSVSNNNNAMGIAVELTRELEILSTQAIDIILISPENRGYVPYALSLVPDWLNAAGTIQGRRGNLPVVCVLKGFRPRETDKPVVFTLSGSTNATALAGAMASTLSNRESSFAEAAPAVRLLFGGQLASTVAMDAVWSLRWMIGQEVVFHVEKKGNKEEKGTSMLVMLNN